MAELPSTPFLLGNTSFAAITARAVLRIPADIAQLNTDADEIARRLVDISPVPLSQAFLMIEYQDSFNVALFSSVCAQCHCPGLLVGNCDGQTKTYFTWISTPNRQVPSVAITSQITATILDSVSSSNTSYVMTSVGIDLGWEALQETAWLMSTAVALYLVLAILAVFKGIAFVLDGNGDRLSFSHVPKPQIIIVSLHFAAAMGDLLTFLNFAALNTRGFSYIAQTVLSQVSNPFYTSATMAMALLLREASQFGVQTVGERLFKVVVYLLAVTLLAGSFAAYLHQIISWRQFANIDLETLLVVINYFCASIYFIYFGYATTKRLLVVKGSLSDEEIRRRRRFALRLARSGVCGLIAFVNLLGIAASVATKGSFSTFFTLYGLLAITSAITRIMELSAFTPVGQKHLLGRLKALPIVRNMASALLASNSSTARVHPASSTPLRLLP